MSDEKKLPFHSFAFTLIEDKQPRAVLRMTAGDEGLYELDVLRGSAANPLSHFTRQVPCAVAERLRDAMQSAGVFGWEEEYGDAAATAARRWTLSIVFQEGVFSLESKGGSDVPAGFDQLLEELYRLDFPRPSATRSGSQAASAGADFSQMSDLLKAGGIPGLDASEMQTFLAEAQSNPQAFQQRMKDEFAHLPPDAQNSLLDALAATGLASREWWERFLRG